MNRSKIELLSRKCGICSTNFGYVLHKQNFVLPDSSSIPSTFNIVACHQCGFVYADMKATQKDYELYYSTESIYETEGISIGGNQSWEKSRFNEMVADLSVHLLDKKAKILDIGCATGGLLNVLKVYGYENLNGLDPSESCILSIEKSGFTGYKGGIFSDVFISPDLPSDFECIILSHVLEHIYDIGPAIERISNKLKYGGIFYIEVPDASKYLEFYKAPYYFFENEHINHFDISSLNNLLKNNSFEVLGSGERTFKSSATDTYPSLYIILRKTRINENTYKTIKVDFSLKEIIEKFVEKSALELGLINSEIEKLINSKERILIWGAGNNTYKLLANTKLRECNIVSIIDKDTNKQGIILDGIIIGSLEELKNFNGTIVISSIMHSKDINDEIRDMGLHNKIVILK